MRKTEQSEQMKTRSLVLKIWQEEIASDLMGLRGEVRDPVKRETKYFSNWAGLKAILESSLVVDVCIDPKAVQLKKR